MSQNTVRDALEVLYKVSTILSRGLEEELKKFAGSQSDRPERKTEWNDLEVSEQQAILKFLKEMKKNPAVPVEKKKKYTKAARTLTIEALDEIGFEWPDWATCAIVNNSGFAHVYEVVPIPRISLGQWVGGGMSSMIPGVWSIVDWSRNILYKPAISSEPTSPDIQKGMPQDTPSTEIKIEDLMQTKLRDSYGKANGDSEKVHHTHREGPIDDAFKAYSGRKLKLIREKYALSVKDVATLSSLSGTTIRCVERGEYVFTKKSAKIIADALGINITEFEPDPGETIPHRLRNAKKMPMFQHLEYYDRNKVRAFRMNAGLTQKELAKKIGLSQLHFSRIERGGNTISDEHATKIAKALNIRIDELQLEKPRIFNSGVVIDHGYSGILLRKYRLEKNILTADLAKMTKTAASSITSIETGRVSFTPKTAVKYAHALGINVEQFEKRNEASKEEN